MAAGSVGGICLWTAIFPADVIKSRVQINNIQTNMFVMGAQIVRTEGVSALYNGLKPTILRTIPATAVLFAVYEYSKKFMSNVFMNWEIENNNEKNVYICRVIFAACQEHAFLKNFFQEKKGK